MKLSTRLKKFSSAVMVGAFILGFSGITAMADTATTQSAIVVTSPADSVKSSDIVVLYENDVHNAIDGYATLAALKKDMKGKTYNVGVVSSGDFAQGATIGALSKGENIIEIMNRVGYDAVTLGNHEFDYQIPQLKKLTFKLKSKVVSCNFVDLKKNRSVYDSYVIKRYGNKKIAYVGITTPETFTKSTPAYFQDKKGNYLYGFCEDETGQALYSKVQATVDEARKAGANYVVVLAHLGTEGITPRWTSTSVVQNTTGIDVVLDGHSHSTIVEDTVKNKAGKDVIVSSTGTAFANIGELVITQDGKMTTQLVSLKNYTKKDAYISTCVSAMKGRYKSEMTKVIGKTTVDLTTLDATTNKRAVRSAETNLGDFCTDALRNVFSTDIAIMNGGGIRADIKAGDITYNSLLSVFPWGNMGCVMEVTGQQLKDALELGAMNNPKESGGFLQVSGMTYEINTAVPSSVKVDSKGMFQSVNGDYRVENIKVLNSKTGKYEALDLNKKYTLAGINYTLKSSGDGYTMFKNATLIKDEVAVDAEILITYLTNNLKGVVGNDYVNPSGQGRIIIKK